MVRFRIPLARFRIPKTKITWIPDSGFRITLHGANFGDFWKPASLSVEEGGE